MIDKIHLLFEITLGFTANSTNYAHYISKELVDLLPSTSQYLVKISCKTSWLKGFWIYS